MPEVGQREIREPHGIKGIIASEDDDDEDTALK